MSEIPELPVLAMPQIQRRKGSRESGTASNGWGHLIAQNAVHTGSAHQKPAWVELCWALVHKMCKHFCSKNNPADVDKSA